MGRVHPFCVFTSNCVCVSESAEGRGKDVPQPFRVPISSQKLSDSVKEMDYSIISSWAMGSTCLLMQRGSDLVRAVAEQGRYEAHKQQLIGFFFDLSSDELPVHLEKH